MKKQLRIFTMHCKLMGRVLVVGSQICYSYEQKKQTIYLGYLHDQDV